ncbi:MAG: hypothetical protein WCA92_12290, partial [Terriglobales bacterium]
AYKPPRESMSRTLLSLAGFQVIITGRFWVIAEVLSDMRHHTGNLNLETSVKFNARAALAKTEQQGLIANLSNVEVYVLGADNAGKPTEYWGQHREYWLEYFAKAGCQMRSYSVLRELTLSHLLGRVVSWHMAHQVID